MASNDPAIVAHVYFDYRDRGNQSLEQIVASILQQVASALPILPTAVTTFHEMFGRQCKTAKLQDFVQALMSAARDSPKVFLVIDALDECHTKLRRQLFNVLDCLKDSISIFVTSRSHIQDIKQAFGSTPSIEIKAHHSDLRRCISYEIEASDWKDDLNESYRNEIVDKIISNTEDM